MGNALSRTIPGQRRTEGRSAFSLAFAREQQRRPNKLALLQTNRVEYCLGVHLGLEIIQQIIDY